MNHPKLLFLLLTLAAAGCSSAAKPPAGAATSKEFQYLLDSSVKELQVKNSAHQSWGLGKFDRWDLDQDTGTLVFSNPDGSTVTTTAQIIGSFSTSDNSWLWAWDNPSIEGKLKQDALQVKAYGEEHGIERLTTRKWTGTEEDAWAMAALAVKLCGSEGAYRGPSGNSYVFITFRDIKIGKKPAP
ncbi:MAG: hypothetical protein IAF94_25930 [Pirellulaceae bacterium]|nr:hypothetical protein [Pirellulaceae bacterium]